MLKTEQYTLFRNSKDFDILFRKSFIDLSKEFTDKNFVDQLIKPALEKRHCILLYINDQPIGYQVVFIKKRVINGGYTFILNEHRGKGYSYIIRKAIYDLVKNDVDDIVTFIRRSNIASSESAKKIAEKLNLTFEEENIFDENFNFIGKKYKIKNE